MGVRISPCYRCPLSSGCEQREVFRQKACGIGASSVKFRCAKIREAMEPGTRICVEHPYLDEDDGYGKRVCTEHMPATITHSDGFRFSCVVDPHEFIEADKYRFRKPMLPHRIIRFLDEPKRALCKCGNPILPDGSVDTSEGRKEKCDCFLSFDEFDSAA